MKFKNYDFDFFELGRKAEKNNDWPTAIIYYNKGFHQGCPLCYFAKGMDLYNGYTCKQDRESANVYFRWAYSRLEKLSREGFHYASLLIYELYYKGIYFKKSYQLARYYLNLAIKQGSIEGLEIRARDELILGVNLVDNLKIIINCMNILEHDYSGDIPFTKILKSEYTYENILEYISIFMNAKFPNKRIDDFIKELNTIKINIEEEKKRREKEIEDITSMTLSLDWNNVFDDSPITEGVHVESISDALISSLNTLGCVDIEYIAKVSSSTLHEVIYKLKGSIYQDPRKWNECFYKGWVTADEYLSGNLLTKLTEAKEANVEYKGYFSDNITALKKVLPKGIASEDIFITISSPWVPKDIVVDFIMTRANCRKVTGVEFIKYEEITGTWDISTTMKYYTKDYLYNFDLLYGTKKLSGIELVKRTLNMNTLSVMEKNNENKYQLNKNETLLAMEKQKILNEDFKQYIFESKTRTKKVTDAYNNLYAYNVSRIYDGNFLEFPGMNKEVNLFEYQKSAIARIIFNKNTLLAHEVGSGKTYIMIASGEKMLQTGISKKNLYVVPNSIITQWESDYKYLYPDANIKVVYPKHFVPKKRREVLEDIRDNSYNAIIMPYSCFELITTSYDYRISELQKRIDKIKKANKKQSSLKLTKLIEKLEKEVTKLKAVVKDNADIAYDKLGITRLYIDEAHNYKNVPIESKIERVLGINKAGSTKCKEMKEKVKYTVSRHDGGVIMATGTPITNSITDCYVFQSYLQEGELKLCNINTFDDWVSMFAEKNEEFEVDVDSSGYRMATRFSRFHNLPELTAILANIADFYVLEKNDELPDFNGYKDIVLPKNRLLDEYVTSLAERADLCRRGKVKRSEDNMLKITTDGRKAALDLRLIDDKKYTLRSNTKAYRCAENVFYIYQNTKDNNLTQLIFCDSSTPKDSFNLYDEVRKILEILGIKREEMEFIHTGTTESKRADILDKTNKGEIKVLFGSTFKLGIGVNVQDRLVAIHHLDVPWRPADMVQREGRIIRKGNINKEVFIYRYIQEGSFDAYSWQLLETKQAFINELLSNSISNRSADDVDNTVLNYGEVKALAIGNPKIRERFEVENELNKLKILNTKNKQMRWMREKELSDTNSQIKELKSRKELFEKDIDLYNDSYKKYTTEERNEIRDLLYDELKDYILMKDDKFIMNYQGFEIYAPRNMVVDKSFLYLKGNYKHVIEISLAKAGIIVRIDNYLDNLQSALHKINTDLSANKNKVKFLKQELEKDVNFDEKIHALKVKLEKIDKELKK